MPILAQAKEIAEAAQGWGEQLPALALGLLGMGALVWFFLRHLGGRESASAAERRERDALWAETIREVSERADKTAQVCHATQQAATERERQTAEVLGSVKGALERSTTVTMDVGRVVEEARREIERSRLREQRVA